MNNIMNNDISNKQLVLLNYYPFSQLLIARLFAIT